MTLLNQLLFGSGQPAPQAQPQPSQPIVPPLNPQGPAPFTPPPIDFSNPVAAQALAAAFANPQFGSIDPDRFGGQTRMPTAEEQAAHRARLLERGTVSDVRRQQRVSGNVPPTQLELLQQQIALLMARINGQGRRGDQGGRGPGDTPSGGAGTNQGPGHSGDIGQE